MHIIVLSLFAVVVLHPELVREGEVIGNENTLQNTDQAFIGNSNFSIANVQWLKERRLSNGKLQNFEV